MNLHSLIYCNCWLWILQVSFFCWVAVDCIPSKFMFRVNNRNKCEICSNTQEGRQWYLFGVFIIKSERISHLLRVLLLLTLVIYLFSGMFTDNKVALLLTMNKPSAFWHSIPLNTSFLLLCLLLHINNSVRWHSAWFYDWIYHWVFGKPLVLYIRKIGHSGHQAAKNLGYSLHYFADVDHRSSTGDCRNSLAVLKPPYNKSVFSKGTLKFYNQTMYSLAIYNLRS